MGTAAAGAVALGAVAGAAKLIPKAAAAPSMLEPAPAASAAFVQAAGVPAQSDVFGNPSPTILTADVVVCGYGATGIPAAIEAYDAGATNVIVIEKANWLGGQSRRNAGVLQSASTVVQAALGVNDSFNEFYAYLLACGQGMADPSLVRSFATNDNVDWVINTLGGQPVSEWSLGTPVVPTNTPDNKLPLTMGPGLSYAWNDEAHFQEFGCPAIPRAHGFNPNPADAAFWENPANFCINVLEPGAIVGGTGVFQTLNNAIAARPGITVMTSTTLVSLVTGTNGEVLGISATGADGNPLLIEAKRGVIIGTGGWSQNESMIENYLMIPESEIVLGTNPFTVALPVEEDGAGILAAQAIGAATVFMGGGGGWTTAMQAAGYQVPEVGCGGLKINADSQVININGDPIPRLYAGGRAAGGTLYLIYPAGGCGFGTAMWQGRLAGRNAAALTPWTS